MWSRKYDNCVQCGKDTRRHKAKGFCRRCYNKRFKSYISSRDRKYFGGKWKTLTEGAICRICKTTQDLVVHHKDLDKDNFAETNLIVLCRRCHSKWHKFLRLGDYFLNYMEVCG